MAQLLSVPIIITIVITLPSPHPNPTPALSTWVVQHNCNQYVMLNQGRSQVLLFAKTKESGENNSFPFFESFLC